MIPLVLRARAETAQPFVARLEEGAATTAHSAVLLSHSGAEWLFSGAHGLFSIYADEPLVGDVVSVDPARAIAERLVRHDSVHNTFLVTERCDQLCVMCSQPPKKTHQDRFETFTQAALLAPANAVIGFSGGEPTLYKEELFSLLHKVSAARPDLSFHILSNGQHFYDADIPDIATLAPQALWGIPLYSHDRDTHDSIVAKPGAYDRLLDSMIHCLKAGMRIELRTVILRSNIDHLPELARMIATHLGFISQWSIMQLEHIGFAKNRFDELYVDHAKRFTPIASALDIAQLYGIPVSLFNVTRCSVPSAYRTYAAASISDWKRKYAAACHSCTEQGVCGGFFAWHPDEHMMVRPL